MTIDTLCSSSLVALHTAVRSIRNGECDQAIVAGVRLAMSPLYFTGCGTCGPSRRRVRRGRLMRGRMGLCRVRVW